MDTMLALCRYLKMWELFFQTMRREVNTRAVRSYTVVYQLLLPEH